MGLLKSECDVDKHTDVSSSSERYATGVVAAICSGC